MSETCQPCPPTKLLDNNEAYVFSFYEDVVQVNTFILPSVFSVCFACLCLVILGMKYRNIYFVLISNLEKIFIIVSFMHNFHAPLSLLAQDINKTTIDFALFREITLVHPRNEKKLNKIKILFCCFRLRRKQNSWKISNVSEFMLKNKFTFS